MSKFKKNVPIPSIRPVENPLAKMKVGNSLFLPLKTYQEVNRFRVRICTTFKEKGKLYITRHVSGGLMVWRKK